jgi:hypothetical protein
MESVSGDRLGDVNRSRGRLPFPPSPGPDTWPDYRAGVSTPAEQGPPEAVLAAATDAERRALASVIRLRILRMCLYESLTNKEISDRLHRDPATVLHHVRTLVNTGFLAAGDPRTGPRGSREVPYRATMKSWSTRFGEPTDPEALVDPSGATMSSVMLRTFFEEVSEVPEPQLDISRLGLQLADEHLAELRSRIFDLLQEYVDRGPDPGGRRYSLFVALHREPR